MKKFLKILGAILAVIVIYCAVMMLVVDSKVHNEQSILINAPKEKVWQNVNSMRAFNTWNPWMKFDPNIVVTYKGTPGEVGDGYHWKGNADAGEGEEEITAIVPNESVATKMHFIKPMDDTATSNLQLTAEGAATKATWSIDYDVEAYFKPMMPLMNSQMSKSFSEGLGKLKELSEK
ncbi:MAG: SRPBCC family protein [Weeksellaceae bacterium]|nr:SRPBCC family protein [Weeksellaceae bacterium]